MSDSDDYDDFLSDEDISALEDNLSEDLDVSSVITGERLDNIYPDAPVYRLRLLCSNETFLAVWPGELLKPGSMVLVPTRYGRDLAQIMGTIQKHNQCLAEIAWIERPATTEDLEKIKLHQEQEKEAFALCKQKIDEHDLDMKLVSVHYLLEEPKILFFFTAENRVDFRDLVKDLVSIFKSRIELRQIGVRDESRVIGGLGVCGRGYCCHAVSDKLKPVSIKMAKDQNLSLNSIKISGSCGRLLCCLAYEHQFYSEQRRLVPPEGCKIFWDSSLWKVTEVNVVLGKLKLATEDGRVTQFPAAAFEKVEGRWTIKTS